MVFCRLAITALRPAAAAPGSGAPPASTLAVGQHHLLAAPDDAPHVEQHDGAQQHAGTDGDAAGTLAEPVGVVVLGDDRDEDAGDEGADCRPAEPPQRLAGHLVDGDEASLAADLLVRLGFELTERRHLHEVEVVQQTDPGDAGQDVQPAEPEAAKAVCTEETVVICEHYSVPLPCEN